MHRIARPSRSIGLLRINTPPNPYVCSICRRQAPAFSTTSLRPATKQVGYANKMQNMLWGDNKPPGDGDPWLEKQDSKDAKPESEPRKIAATRELPSDYQPALSWDGLESVGEVLIPSRPFGAFLPKELVTDSEELTAALHRAMVEIFSLKQAGRPLLDASANAPELDYTQDVQISPSADGVELQFTKDSSLAEVLQSLGPTNETDVKEAPTESEEDIAADRSEEDPLHPDESTTVVDETAEKENPTESEEEVAADRSEVDPLQHTQSNMTYGELIASWDPSWLQVSIEDPEVKFAVLKRTLQLTGVRVPDSAIKSANTAQSILSHLVTPPKPRKLIESLEQKEELLTMPNVTVYPKRVTYVDKEIAAGRWKLIKKELKSRHLPVFGH